MTEAPNTDPVLAAALLETQRAILCREQNRILVDGRAERRRWLGARLTAWGRAQGYSMAPSMAIAATDDTTIFRAKLTNARYAAREQIGIPWSDASDRLRHPALWNSDVIRRAAGEWRTAARGIVLSLDLPLRHSHSAAWRLGAAWQGPRPPPERWPPPRPEVRSSERRGTGHRQQVTYLIDRVGMKPVGRGRG